MYFDVDIYFKWICIFIKNVNTITWILIYFHMYTYVFPCIFMYICIFVKITKLHWCVNAISWILIFISWRIRPKKLYRIWCLADTADLQLYLALLANPAISTSKFVSTQASVTFASLVIASISSTVTLLKTLVSVGVRNTSNITIWWLMTNLK